MTNSINVRDLEAACRPMLKKLARVQDQLRETLLVHADGKKLKGNELVAWLGEIYGKLLLDGTLVGEDKEHDFTSTKWPRVSVKTRKGFNQGWQRSSAIPTQTGVACPTHLLFVHLNDDYSIDRMWLFPWSLLLKGNRIAPHVVRGVHRSFIFKLDEARDARYLAYGK